MSLGPNTLAAVTAGTASATVLGGSQILASLYVEADGSNTSPIYLGDANTSTTRYMTNLAAGKGIWISAPLPSRPDSSNLNLNLFYVITTAASQKVHVTYFERLGGLT